MARRTASRAGFPRAIRAPRLDAAAARAIAEERAQADWAIDSQALQACIEQSQVERPSKRIDHVLGLRAPDARLGEGRYRLRLGVSGDTLTEVSYFVHVPEAFGLRYAELRSANETIARVASMVAGALYGIGGCILGVLWLLRQRLAAVETGAGRRRASWRGSTRSPCC